LTLGEASSSPEERSTTGNPSKGSPCSYIGDSDPRHETSSEEAGGSEDPVGEGDDGEASLDEDPLASMHKLMIPLLSPILNKWRERGKT
jgi:hypothetical protein